MAVQIAIVVFGRLDWTKSFAWNSETDCINLMGPGGRVSNNFFKTNDDCMKAYQNDSVYRGNVVRLVVNAFTAQTSCGAVTRFTIALSYACCGWCLSRFGTKLSDVRSCFHGSWPV